MLSRSISRTSQANGAKRKMQMKIRQIRNGIEVIARLDK